MDVTCEDEQLASYRSCEGSSYLFTEYKYPVDPGAGQRNRAEYARQYGPVIIVMLCHLNHLNLPIGIIYRYRGTTMVGIPAVRNGFKENFREVHEQEFGRARLGESAVDSSNNKCNRSKKTIGLGP